MADENQGGAAGGTATESKTMDTQASKTEDAEDFDKDRALATIRKLRESEKAWKQTQKELDTLKAEKAQAEQDRLKAAGEHKTLYEQAQAKLAELEPTVAERDRYKGVVESLAAQERKALPKHILALLDKLDPVDQLAWIAENRETVAKTPPPNVNARDGQGGKPPEDPKAKEAELRQRFRF
jgi:hypothetical protein